MFAAFVVAFAAFVLAFATFMVVLAAFVFALATFVIVLAALMLGLAAAIFVGAVLAMGGGTCGVFAVAHMLAAMMLMLTAELGRIDNGLFSGIVVATCGHAESKSDSGNSG